MSSRKMAIVSSYSESCGNASFTKVVHDSIETFHSDIKVDVLELDLKLLQSVNGAVRRKADRHIDAMCAELEGYDLVNIQMEAGLYGTLPRDIVKRFTKLVSANKNTTVTMHSPRLVGSAQSGARSAIKKLLHFDIKGAIKDFLGDKYSQVHININKKIVAAAVRHHARIIVHTARSAKLIKDFYSYDNVALHPLKMIPSDYKANPSTLEFIASEAGFKEGDVLIGMFGYISAYKGHADALKALESLPDNYKLLIFGRQHPQTLKSNGKKDAYLETLVGLILQNKSLKDRVFFMGELSDQEFLDVVGEVDISWLPYYENGQDGSGIASICVDLCPRVLCSTSFAFDELFKLVRYSNVRRFDIGNTLEMASKTQMFVSGPKAQMPFGDESVYSLKTQADTYVLDVVI